VLRAPVVPRTLSAAASVRDAATRPSSQSVVGESVGHVTPCSINVAVVTNCPERRRELDTWLQDPDALDEQRRRLIRVFVSGLRERSTTSSQIEIMTHRGEGYAIGERQL
jgi:hypothetical protein